MTRSLAFAALLCACASSREVRQDSARDTTAQVDARTVRTEGAEQITTTVEEYEPEPSDWGMPAADSPAPADAGPRPDERSARAGSPAPRVPTLTPQTVLVKRTVTVDQRGPVVVEHQRETHEEAKASADSDAKTSSKPSGGCIGSAYLIGLAILAVVVGGGYVARRLRVI